MKDLQHLMTRIMTDKIDWPLIETTLMAPYVEALKACDESLL